MIKYVPRPYRRGYVYLMQKDEVETLKAVIHLRNTLIDRRICVETENRVDKKYWGWMRFSQPLPLWDAMEGGLVPIFNCYKSGAS